MAQGEPCDKCDRKMSCREVFRRLSSPGGPEGKSIVRGVLSAFVLPLVVFIAVLAAAQQLLSGYIESSGLRTAAALSAGVVAAAACVAIVKIFGKWLGGK